MRYLRFRPAFFAIAMAFGVIVTLLACAEACEDSVEGGAETPKLVVLVVFDQMRGDYLVKWQELFDKDGFGQLLRDGAWYQDCHYPYAYTLTAPGHASMVTGCAPSKHGIIANDWYDRNLRTETSAIKTLRYHTVPASPDPKASDDGPAPLHRKQPSVGDCLHKMSQGKAKIVSLSFKARAAILMAALRATAVYWFDTVRGLFVTSTYYHDTPHPWVAEFNKERPADNYFGKDWTKLRPDLDYAKYSGPDDVAAEGSGYMQGRTFPHSMTGGINKPGEKFYNAFDLSPYASEALLELARRAIDAEQLGQRDVCDLLCLSFSSNDLIGHAWGPDSQEVLDITLRSDLIIKELLRHLDAKVGKGKYVMVVTADHGVCPIPEVAKAQGKDAGRVAPNLFTSKAADHLQKTFAPKEKQLPWIEKWSAEWIYLNHGTLKEAGVAAAKAEEALVDWLRQQPGIQAAFGRTRLDLGPLPGDAIGEMVRLSYHPDCSGDVAVVLKPYHLVSGPIAEGKNESYRTTHGSPHPYDTHVPLVVFGTGVRPGVHQERVTPLATAAILARALGIPPPEGAAYPVPDGLFR